MKYPCSVFKGQIALLFFTFFGIGIGYSQSPKFDWGVWMPSNSEERTDEFLKILGERDLGEVILNAGYFDQFKKAPKDIQLILRRNKIDEIGISGGEVGRNLLSGEVEKFDSLGLFLNQIGGKYLILTFRKRDSYPPGKEELVQTGKFLDQLSIRLKKHGVQVVISNKMNSICQTAEEFQSISNACSKNVLFMLDVANFVQAGGNPLDFTSKNKKRVKFFVFQGLVSPKPGFSGSSNLNFQLVDLSKNPNQIDLKSLFSGLKKQGIRGIALIKTPENPDIQVFQNSIEIQTNYLKQEFGISFD